MANFRLSDLLKMLSGAAAVAGGIYGAANSGSTTIPGENIVPTTTTGEAQFSPDLPPAMRQYEPGPESIKPGINTPPRTVPNTTLQAQQGGYLDKLLESLYRRYWR